jgi:hypothetical protein
MPTGLDRNIASLKSVAWRTAFTHDAQLGSTTRAVTSTAVIAIDEDRCRTAIRRRPTGGVAFQAAGNLTLAFEACWLGILHVASRATGIRIAAIQGVGGGDTTLKTEPLSCTTTGIDIRGIHHQRAAQSETDCNEAKPDAARCCN